MNILWFAIGLTLFIYILEEIIFFRPQINYWMNAKHFVEFTTAMLAVLLTILFFYSALVSPAWLKFMTALFFVVTLTGEYGYQRVMGRFAVAGDIEIGFISQSGIWKATGALYFNKQVIVPSVVFLITILVARPTPDWITGAGSLGGVILAVFLLSLIQPKFIYRFNWGPSPIQAIRTFLDFVRARLTKVKRETLTFHSAAKPTNNIVLIVDESLRADHMSVNGYARATTPYLDELAAHAKFFHNWGIAVPGATCSNTSNGLLGSGAPIQPGGLDLIYKYPSGFQYAKAMGYRTVYIDAQTSILWNGINENDLAYIDVWIKATGLGDDKLTVDFTAAERIREIVGGSTGNFVVFNKRGVHYLYESNYPPEAAVWRPVPEKPANYEAYPDQAVNSFDNAILYNVNTFFTRLFPDPVNFDERLKNTIYIYTSDHAETLYEDGAKVTHCSGTRHETRVPLMIFGELPVPLDTNYLASHSNILPTILDLMSVPLEARAHAYNHSLLKATTKDSKGRLFFDSDGTIVNHDELERNAESKTLGADHG